MKVLANTIRSGNVMDHNGKLWVVLKVDNIQPGKGAAVVQIEMRDIRTGTKTNERFRTQESVERIILDSADYQYLYPEDDDNFIFMHKESYDQITVPREVIGESAPYLQDGMEVILETYDGTPLRATLPDTAIVTVAETDVVLKGQTAAASYKPAILDNGERINVPPHIETGQRVVVKTADGSYVERAKN